MMVASGRNARQIGRKSKVEEVESVAWVSNSQMPLCAFRDVNRIPNKQKIKADARVSLALMKNV